MVRKVPVKLFVWVRCQSSKGSCQMGYEDDSSVIPALAIRMLMGPWWCTASEMEDWMEDSEVISPLTSKRFGELAKEVMGLRSWAETLQP